MACKKGEYIFITEPDDNLLCSICLDLPIQPKQCEDCGKLFCTECIEKHGSRPCPNCRIEKPRFFKDAKSKDYHTYLMCYAINILISGRREIKELKVRCDNTDRGCQWTGTIGTLDSHMSTCQFALVSCPNECEEDGQLTIMGKDLDNHLKTCPNRAHQCQHCGEKGTYASITEDHDKVCNKKIVPCPNKERGCPLYMEREKTKHHVRSVCDYTEVACTYESLGCGVRIMRKDVMEHETNDREQHLTFALVTVTKQSERIKELAEQIMTLSVKIKAFVFKVPGYTSKKEKNYDIKSTPFYTHPGGYKMCISVFINGNDDGEDTHVSVFINILEGHHDDQLYWPFVGTVKFELLNQLTDDRHYSMSITFDDSDDMQVGSAMGCTKFIPHSSLSHDPATNTQYLLGNTLYFRVSVTVANHKPWLVCTDQTNAVLSNCDSTENNDQFDKEAISLLVEQVIEELYGENDSDDY